MRKNFLEQREKVRKMLLMPIVVDKKVKEIHIKDDIIYSGQKYYSTADEDMSDFAIWFYEIIYGELLSCQTILNEQRKILNNCFAGDTINSFNSIANISKGAGISKSKRTDKKFWDEDLQKYYNNYHCLANFWIIPSYLGRRSAKLNKFDSVDIFLNRIKNDNRLWEKYENFFQKIKNYDNFLEIHFITDYEIMSDSEINDLYQKKEFKKLIERANLFMEQRADLMVLNQRVCEKLYNYFKKLYLF